ncbi:MAG: (2Fe-2S)-binding protein [Alphaproteobacteria bacterium]
MTRRVGRPLAKSSSDPTREISLTVNGEAVTRRVSTRLLLSDFLRHELGLTGTHVGCEHGVCGCCTVSLDGVAARSCLAFAVQADGATIRTIEGVAGSDDVLHPVQQAFHECHALQCGFCTPGFIMSVVTIFEENENPDLNEDAIREALSGNLCRCTGYQNIVKAVRRAHELMTTGKGT